MKLVGLTGGIGSGKSTVSAALVRRGAVLVDADAIVHDLQRPGTIVFSEMVDRFGDEQALADLGMIVHPRVHEEIERRVAEQADDDNVVVLDIPLLDRNGWPGLVGTIVVDLDPEVAVQRLVQHRGFEESDARARMANQASREDRLKLADHVVDNSGSADELEAEVDACWEWIQGLPDSP